MKNIFVLLVFMLAALPLQSQQRPLYLDENAPVEDRVADLLSRMTTEEKVGLLRTTSPAIPRLGIARYNHGNEALHGVVRPGKFTVFPQAIALASSWNPELHYEIATVISDEARARWNELGHGELVDEQYSDLLTFFSPTINMARDPRWGRTPETYGEDPYLAGVLGVEFIKGLQGNHPKYTKTVSIAKHFAANNEEHNRFECDAVISERGLREYYLPAFEMAVKKGGVSGIMSAYNAINGIPCTANPWLLNKVLREDWGFGGYVISDCGAPDFLVTHHKYVKTNELAATVAIKSGLDAECTDHIFMEPLLNAYRLGMVSQEDIDRAATRILTARMKLGMFDDPGNNPYNQIPPSVIGSEKHRELTLESARQGIVLLKNSDKTLPIDTKKVGSIAVVGINAASCEFGDYSGIPLNEPVSILDGIVRRAGDKIVVKHAPWVSLRSNDLIGKSFFDGPVKVEYFDNKNLAGEPRVRYEEWINYDPANVPPDPVVPKAPVSIRWTGKLKASVSGRHTLGLTTDDGCRMYVDGEIVVDNWIDRASTTDYHEMDMVADRTYDIIVEYYDSGLGALAQLSWTRPEVPEQETLASYGEAGTIVKECDMVVAVMGIDKSIEREGRDREDIVLPKDQLDFLQAMHKLNPNMVVVLVAGSSLAINWIEDHVPAIVNAWYSGEQGGTAVAEVLFGDYNPAGRLPLTYYNSLDELPPFDEYEITDGRTYQYFRGTPLYPFGYGLSYTTFKYSGLSVSDAGDKINVSFDVRNTGRFDGDEVAQIYVKFPHMGIPMPIKQLKGFRRVNLKKGEKTGITIELDKSELRYWDEDAGKFVTPSGSYSVMVGASSDDIRLSQDIVF